MSGYISLKLPNTVITLHTPPLQANDATTPLSGSIRVTQAMNTRVTRGGNTRVTRDYTIPTRPELAVLKVGNGVISILVPGPKPNRSRTGSNYLRS